MGKKSATVANPSHLVSGSNPWPNGHMPYIYISLTSMLGLDQGGFRSVIVLPKPWMSESIMFERF